jgi:exodeoxyribonuclease III
LKVVSINLNGLRASLKKGLLGIITDYSPDIICAQEVRCQDADFEKIKSKEWQTLTPKYHTYYFAAQKKGYSGVMICSKVEPKAVRFGLDIPAFAEFNDEGRWIEADFDGFTVICAYFPSGSSSEDRQNAKFRFLEIIAPYLQSIAHQSIILCGDLNIAHQEIDLKNWKGNLQNSGFLPEERAWMTQLFQNYQDVYRKLYPNQPGYTWWSQRGQAFNNNVGWRIDYQITSPNFLYQAQEAVILKEARISDHAWLMINYQSSPKN